MGLVSKDRPIRKRTYICYIYHRCDPKTKKEIPTETVRIQAQNLDECRKLTTKYLKDPTVTDVAINNDHNTGRKGYDPDWIFYGYYHMWEIDGKETPTWLGEVGRTVQTCTVDPKTGNLGKRVYKYDVRVFNSKMNDERFVLHVTSLTALRSLIKKRFPGSKFKVFDITGERFDRVSLGNGMDMETAPKRS